MSIPVSPPESPSLPTVALARVFDNVVSSQKFLWMLAILDALSLSRFRDSNGPIIPMDFLVCHMLNTAKGTLERFRLQQFSHHDKFHPYLELCRQRNGIFTREYSLDELPGVCGRIPRSVYNPLTASTAAPYRFLGPFLPDIKMTTANVRQKAADLFSKDSPVPYHFSKDGKAIIIHSGWAAYFVDNADIVRGWTLWNWARFLEIRNPSTPSLTAKITGVVRGPLAKPRKLWDATFLHSPHMARCIYSGEALELDNYSVDHYLPWEFIGHDNFWNLVPTLKEVNSSKSDILPDNRYLDRLAKIHHVAIVTYHEHPDLRRGCGRLMLSYSDDLQVNAHDSPPDESKIREAYRRTIPAFMALARNQGFRTGWRHRKVGVKNKRTQSPPVP